MLTLLIDWNRTLYDPEKKLCYRDAVSFLRSLQKKCVVYIVSAGKIPHTHQQKKKVLPYIDDFIVAPKTKDLFTEIVKNTPKNRIIVIGDSITQEITIANKLAYTSVRILRGTYKDDIPTTKNEIPTYTVHALKEILCFLPLSF